MTAIRTLTILSLMGGRWHTLEGFMACLGTLEVDPDATSLLWFTNGGENFVTILERFAVEFREKGFEVRVVHDDSLPQSDNVFCEGGDRTDVHINTITALYNAAWQYVETDDVLLLEDDVYVPSHAIRRLKKAVDERPDAVLVSGSVFDRHTGHNGSAADYPLIFVWDLIRSPVRQNGEMERIWMVASPKIIWGVRKVATTGFACSLIRRSRLPEALAAQQFPFKTENPIQGMSHLRGPDIVFGLELNHYGKEVYCDFDVRPGHIDSKSHVH